MSTPISQLNTQQVEEIMSKAPIEMQIIFQQQRQMIKAITGLNTMFAAVQQVFTMIATQFKGVLEADPAKQMKMAEEANKQINAIHAYVRKLYTDTYKENPTVEVKKID